MFDFIVDWLDSGNNKKALQECDKVLKKTPNLHCAKALKAFTLHRMGKEVESQTILDALTKEQPTDDATLQAMTLCYREKQEREYSHFMPFIIFDYCLFKWKKSANYTKLL